jgi:hypothetical protein
LDYYNNHYADRETEIDTTKWMGFIFVVCEQPVVHMRNFERLLSHFERQTSIRPGGAKPIVRHEKSRSTGR